ICRANVKSCAGKKFILFRNLCYRSLLFLMNPYYFHPMPKTSRRKFITGMAVLGAASLVRGSTNLIPASASQPSSDSSWSADDRKAASDRSEERRVGKEG